MSARKFTFVEVEAADIASRSGAVREIFDRTVDGLIVRGVLAPDVLLRVTDRLERGDHTLPRVYFPGFPEAEGSPHVYGRTIVSCAPDLVEYLRDASAFRRGVKPLFAGGPDFEEVVTRAFTTLGGGLPASVPPAPNGATYTSATIRVLPEGHQIGVHVGNSFLRLPQARHLATMVDLEDQLSWFVPLTMPEGGGELIVYALEWRDVERWLPPVVEGKADRVYDASPEVVAMIETFEKTVVRPRAGDLLLFDGGRNFHRVSRVQGPRPRRTIGGFLAYARDHRAIHFWS